MEKTSLDILDSVPATPSPPHEFIAPSPLAPIEPESLSSTPRLSQLPAALGQTLTSHAAFYDIPMTDAFTELLERYVPVDERPPPSLFDDVKPNVATMVMNHHWRAVARDARQKLVQTCPTDLDTIFQLWYVRLLALYQLGLYQLASAEFEKLGDLPLFDLQVLWAILPFQLGHPLVTLERLSGLAVQHGGSKHENQVYLIMATRLIQMNDAHAAAKILKAVLHRTPSMDIMNSLGRLYLQLGDLATAEQLFNQLDAPQETMQTNRAFLCMAKGEWKQATEILTLLIQQYPENLTAVNNLAVCMVYTNQVSEAMDMLNKTIHAHPTTAGTSQVTVMNLCTLYELRFDGAGLINKKVDVMKQIARWVGDAFNPQCVKLP